MALLCYSGIWKLRLGFGYGFFNLSLRLRYVTALLRFFFGYEMTDQRKSV